MDKLELRAVLDLHDRWLKGENGGKKANLSNADLSRANLSNADLYMTAWPLWCGTKTVKVDINIASQLAAHFCALDCPDAEYQTARAAIISLAKKFKYSQDLGL